MKSHVSQLHVPLLVLLATGHLRAETPIPAVPDPAAGAVPLPLPEAPLPVDFPPAGTTQATAGPASADTIAIHLVKRLVEKGILTQEEAGAMIREAEQQAATASQAQPVPPSAEATPEEELRVTYIPDVVRDQMRDQIQRELEAKAREESWGKTAAPEWTERWRPFGDIRLRGEQVLFPDGNDNTGAFPNFNAINTGTPFDTSGTQFSPQHNVDQDRSRLRLRARAGAEILLGGGYQAGLRLATGESASPTSPNQSLGASGGNFSKYAVWLDRAFLSRELDGGSAGEWTFLAGRFDNPFLSTEIQWDEDLGFDGLAARGRFHPGGDATVFFNGGLFPVFNTDFNFASNQPAKFSSTDKWLTAAQIGVEWHPADELTAKLAVAYYGFSGIEGEVSAPFIPLSEKDAGSTDGTRPSFAQRGNSYIALRNIDNSTAANDFGNKYQYQYYGLASPFQNLTLTGRLDCDHFDPVRISLVGEVVKNLAFDVGNPAKVIGNQGSGGAFEGGDTAWYLAWIVGNPVLQTFGDWQVGLGYRYVESDAVVDGFTDSDFGGGGTNVQGFTIGGSLGLSEAVRVGLRWMSSNEIAGPALSTDTLQLDLNAKF